MNILLIRSSAIGDIVCMYSAIKHLKILYPDSHIDLMSRSANKDIINWLCDVDKHVIFNDKKVDSNVKDIVVGEHRKIVNLLRFIKSYKSKYDLIYVFQKSLKALLLGRLLAPKSKLIGYKNGFLSKLLSRNLVEIDMNTPEYAKHLKLVGATNFTFETGLKPKTLEISNHINNIFKSNKKTILINAFAKWDTRSLKYYQIEELIEKLSQYNNIQLVFVGMKEHSKFIDDMAERYDIIINLLGKTSLEELYYAISKSSIFLTVDSGPMHIAAHLSTKVYAIFGPTSPYRAGYKQHINLNGECPFFPCESSKCKIKNSQCINNQDMLSLANLLMEGLN